MSLRLLQQSVDIIQEDLNPSNQKKKGKQSTAYAGNKQALLHYKISREHRRGQPQKKNLQDVQKELAAKVNKSDENIKRLLALSMNTVKVKDAEKIVQRAHKGRYIKKIIPKVEQESIFTEEDFRKFEEEYCNS